MQLRRNKTTENKPSLIKEGINDPGIFKAVFLGGPPGAGKDYVMGKILKGYGMVEINSDTAFEFLMKKNNLSFLMPDEEETKRNAVRAKAQAITGSKLELALKGRLGVIINGTGDNPTKYNQIKSRLEQLGYDCAMVMVTVTNETSKQRNIERGKQGGREVPEYIRKDKYENIFSHLVEYKSMFGWKFTEVSNEIDTRYAPQEIKDQVAELFMNTYKMLRKFVSAPIKSSAAKEWIDSELKSRGATKFKQVSKFGS